MGGWTIHSFVHYKYLLSHVPIREEAQPGRPSDAALCVGSQEGLRQRGTWAGVHFGSLWLGFGGHEGQHMVLIAINRVKKQAQRGRELCPGHITSKCQG